MSRKIHFDELQMYYQIPYKVNDFITIYQPTIGEIMELGDTRFYASLHPFLCNPTSMRLKLWDDGLDWNKVSEFELFIILHPNMDFQALQLVFRDFDFSILKPMKHTDTNQISLDYVEESESGDIISDIPIIDEDTYTVISEYIRTMLNQHPKVEKAKGRATKEAIIEEDRMNLEFLKNKDDLNRSVLLPLISSMVNHPGFKYKKNELIDVGIVEFMDSVQRLQLYENVTALMSGVYSGMLDTSKINLSKELNWLRDLSESS